MMIPTLPVPSAVSFSMHRFSLGNLESMIASMRRRVEDRAQRSNIKAPALAAGYSPKPQAALDADAYSRVYDALRLHVRAVLDDMESPEFNTHSAMAKGGWQACHIACSLLSQRGFRLIGAGAFSLCFTSNMLPPEQVIKISLSAYDAGPQYWRFAMDNPHLPWAAEVLAMGHCNDTGWRWCVMPLYHKVGHVDYAEKDRMYYGTIMKWAETIGIVDLHNGNIMINGAGRYVITDPVSVPAEHRKRMWNFLNGPGTPSCDE